MLPFRAATAGNAPQQNRWPQRGHPTATAGICRPRGVEGTTQTPDMPNKDFSGELHRPLFAQIPLELLSSCAERKRRRLVFVYAWLFFYAGRADNAFPSIPRLALETGMKEDDVRASISTLLGEGWITRTGSGPNGTNSYRVRMEATRKRRAPKAVGRQRKSGAPPPVKGTPLNGEGTPLKGPPVTGGGDPPLRGPRNGDPINKPLNKEEENQEGLNNYSTTYIHQRDEKIDAAAPSVTTADAVVTGSEIVVSSAENDAPQRHANPATEQHSPLPACAQPHRQLLREWWIRRRSKHPTAPNELSPGDITAILHADALGVLQPFLQHAADSGCKSLATGYRRRCEELRAGPAATAAFDALRTPYLAAPRRVTCQSLPAAQKELSAVLAEGHTIDQLVAALAAEVRAQDQQHASTGFAPFLPDMARWLKERRFAAYLQPHQPVAANAAEFVAPIDPETGAPDPFAYHRHVTGQGQ
jgi:hypothetical protein